MSTDEPTARPPLLDAGGVDPELVGLPAPPRGRRLATLTLMGLVGALAVLTFARTAADVAYFFAPSTPRPLGPAIALDPAALPTNAYVSVRGAPLTSGLVAYDVAFGTERRAVFPLAGQRALLVDAPVPRDGADPAAGRDWHGRLVRLAALGSGFDAVRRHLVDVEGLPVTGETFVLIADAPPGAHAPHLLLAAFCLAVLLLDGWLLLRWFRPLPRS